MTVQRIAAFYDSVPQHDITRVCLAYSVGILTYEILAKTRNIGQKYFQTLTEPWLLTFAACSTIWSATLEPPKLHLEFVALFAAYIFISVANWVSTPSISKSPASLPEYMIDMVAEAKEKKYTSMIGYEDALRQVEIILNTSKKTNAVLLGYPGIGKSSIPETIAYKIAKGLYPPGSFFAGARLIQVEVNSLLADTTFRGMLEKRVAEMIKMAKEDRSIIYFIDEIHMLTGAGSTVGSHVDISRLLLPVMARGDIRILGASTFDDYNMYIRGGFQRRLPQIIIDQPSPEKCYEMLRHNYQETCREGRFKISDRAIAAAIYFSGRDMPNKYFPDKAIDEIEYALSAARLDNPEPAIDITIDVQQIAQAHLTKLQRNGSVEALVAQFNLFLATSPQTIPVGN